MRLLRRIKDWLKSSWSALVRAMRPDCIMSEIGISTGYISRVTSSSFTKVLGNSLGWRLRTRSGFVPSITSFDQLLDLWWASLLERSLQCEYLPLRLILRTSMQHRQQMPFFNSFDGKKILISNIKRL
jgi:hypothetical protein